MWAFRSYLKQSSHSKRHCDELQSIAANRSNFKEKLELYEIDFETARIASLNLLVFKPILNITLAETDKRSQFDMRNIPNVCPQVDSGQLYAEQFRHLKIPQAFFDFVPCCR